MADSRITLAGHSRSYRRKCIGENDREALLFAMSAGRICLPDDNGFADGGQDGITDDRAKTDKHVCVFNRCRGKYESLLFPPFYSFQLVSFRHPRRRCHPSRERASERDGRERGERTRGGITRSCRANICAITREKCHPRGSRRVIASCSIRAMTRSSPSGRARDRAGPSECEESPSSRHGPHSTGHGALFQCFRLQAACTYADLVNKTR